MNFLDAFLLGLVQGLTEFLPVSSSGHLVLIQSLIPGFHQPGVLFDVILHGATLLAVVLFFLRELASIGFSAISGSRITDSREWSPAASRRLIFLLCLGTIPAGVAGVLFRKAVATAFHTGGIVGPALIATGGILFLPKWFGSGKKTLFQMGAGDAFVIGLAQAMALVPGISRSGITIVAGLMRGMRGEDAVKFSFFLSLPAIAGAVFLESIRGLPELSPGDIACYGIGFGVSLLSGLGAIGILLKVVRSGRLKGFAWYCVVAGLIAILFSLGAS